MEHGGKADNGGRPLHHTAHGGLAVVGVPDHFRKGTVVADGTGEDKGNIIFHAAVHDPIVDVVILDELRDGAAPSYPVDHIQVVVVPVRLGSLGVDILSQGSVEHGPFQVVGGKCVPRHEPVYITVLDHCLHGASGVSVKGKCGSHDPEDVSVFFFVFEQLEEAVIVPGVGSLAAAALTEDELIVIVIVGAPEAGAVKVDAFLCVLRAPNDHLVSDLQVTVFYDPEFSVFPQHHTGVHAALFREEPGTVDLEIFRVHGSAVVVLRSNAPDGHFLPGGVRRFGKFRLCKVWFSVFG